MSLTASAQVSRNGEASSTPTPVAPVTEPPPKPPTYTPEQLFGTRELPTVSPPEYERSVGVSAEYQYERNIGSAAGVDGSAAGVDSSVGHHHCSASHVSATVFGPGSDRNPVPGSERITIATRWRLGGSLYPTWGECRGTQCASTGRSQQSMRPASSGASLSGAGGAAAPGYLRPPTNRRHDSPLPGPRIGGEVSELSRLHSAGMGKLERYRLVLAISIVLNLVVGVWIFLAPESFTAVLGPARSSSHDVAKTLGGSALGDQFSLHAGLSRSLEASMAQLVRHRHSDWLRTVFLQSGTGRFHTDGDLRRAVGAPPLRDVSPSRPFGAVHVGPCFWAGIRQTR